MLNWQDEIKVAPAKKAHDFSWLKQASALRSSAEGAAPFDAVRRVSGCPGFSTAAVVSWQGGPSFPKGTEEFPLPGDFVQTF